MSKETEIAHVVLEEAERLGYGRVLIEGTVVDGRVVNIHVETRRSHKLE